MANYQFPWNQVNALVGEHIVPSIFDQFFTTNPFFMRQRGRQKKFSGGRAIQVNLTWKVEGNGGGWFSGMQKLDTTVRDPIQSATFTPKNAYVPLAISWEDEMTVSGPEMVRSLAETKGEIMRNTMFHLLGTDIYNDGSNAQAIAGLQYAFRDWTTTTASGTLQTYGGISRQQTAANVGTNLWWLHSGDPTGYTTGPAGTFIGASGQGINGAVPAGFATTKLRSGKKPSIILSNVGAWTDFHNHLTVGERFEKARMNVDLYNAGWDNIVYRGAPWVADEKAPRSAAKVEKVYLINEESVKLFVHTQANMKWTGWRDPFDQMGRVGFLLWRGELIAVEPRANHVISAVDTSAVS